MLGDVTRISPEAPVQVFDMKISESKLGGAANVSLNVKSLGAEPLLIGVIGNDMEGDILKSTMLKMKQDTLGLIVDKSRPTTCKTRVISDSHHLLRIDSESKRDIDKNIIGKILKILSANIGKVSNIILQDYNKGILTKELIQSVIELANSKKVNVLVDPKFDNFFEYTNAFIFKPNRKELQDALGRKPKSHEELIEICKGLIEKIKCENLVLTLGEQGVIIFEKKNGKIKTSSVPTKARRVADVSGAGDTVISTIAVCLAGGASVKESVEIANFAAGLVVEEVGIVPAERDNLISHINEMIK